MTPATHLPPLPEKRRRSIFLLMALTFTIAVPAMVFYAIGYRYDFGEVNTFTAVGGMYVNSTADDANIFVDGEVVDDMRIFRSAVYVQNLEAGVHEIYVERNELQTWVKELPVFSHLVTEAQSFNMPVRPQIRLLTEWKNEVGNEVVFGTSTIAHLNFASTTNLIQFSTSTATTTLKPNFEYSYIASRFASSSQETLILEEYERYKAERFNFAGDEDDVATTSATTTKEYKDSILYKTADEVFVTWLGDLEDIPYYYCLTNKGPDSTPELYGSHVYEQLTEQISSTTNLSNIDSFEKRFCRDTIRIDRLHQEIAWFDFMPDTEDIVLMLLEDGLYVVEADDRSWQNTQLVYPGNDLEVLIDGGRIFIKDQEFYLEALLEIPEK